MLEKTQMDKLLKNTEDMQQTLQKAQAEMAKIKIEGLADNGVVRVSMNCKHEIIKVLIDPSIMTDKNLLEKMFAMATNDATKKIETYIANRMMDDISTSILNGLQGIKFPG